MKVSFLHFGLPSYYMAYRNRFLKKLDQTERALKKLKEIKTLKDKLDEEALYEVSAKRFEYTFEVL